MHFKAIALKCVSLFFNLLHVRSSLFKYLKKERNSELNHGKILALHCSVLRNAQHQGAVSAPAKSGRHLNNSQGFSPITTNYTQFRKLSVDSVNSNCGASPDAANR